MSADIRALALAVTEALAPFIEDAPKDEAPAPKKGKATKTAKKGSKEVTEEDHKPMALAKDEDDIEAEEATEYTEADLKKMKIKELRALAIELDYHEDEVKDASKADLVAAILADQEGDVEPAEEDEDGDDEGSELDGLSLAELKAEAKKAGIDGRKVRHMDRDEIIALLEEEDEDVDEDEDDAEDDEDEEDYEDAEVDEEDLYTEDELNELSLSELKDVAEDYDLEIPKRTRRNTIVQMILDAQEELLDEEDED